MTGLGGLTPGFTNTKTLLGIRVLYFNPWELKKELEKDIKGVYLLTINDDGGVMVSRMGTSPAFSTTSMALSSNGFYMTFKELNVIIRSHFGTTRRIVDLLAVNCC